MSCRRRWLFRLERLRRDWLAAVLSAIGNRDAVAHAAPQSFGLSLRRAGELVVVLYHRYPRLGFGLAAGILAGIVFGFLQHLRQPAEAPALRPRVESIVIRPETLVRTVDSPANLTYLEKAAIASRIGGRVAQIFVEQGQAVQRGQRLAQLETLELELQLRQAQARLNTAAAQAGVSQARYAASRREADRQIRDLERGQAEIVDARAGFLNARRQLNQRQQIFRLGGASQEEVKGAYTQYLAAMSRYYQTRKTYQMRMVGFRDEDLRRASLTIPQAPEEKRQSFIEFNTETERQDVRAAQAAVQNARLEVESAGSLLREASILTPLAGIVAERALDVGEQAKEGEPIFVVVRMDRLQAQMHAAEGEVHRIRVGQPASCSIDALSGEVVSARVRLLSPIVDLASRTAELRLEIENAGLRLQPGMFARCKVEVERIENAFALPEEALGDRRSDENGERAEIYVLRGDLVFRREVRLGETIGERIQILEGLRAGEEVATSAVDLLQDGLQIDRGAEGAGQ